MIYLDEEYYLSRFPKTDDVFENLDDESKKVFLTRYSVYSNFLYDYLLHKTDIKNHDNEIKDNQEHSFKAVNETKMDMYQFLAKGKLNYYYVRNNLYLNKLSEEEIKFLDDRIASNNMAYDKEVEDFIGKTIKNVISFSDDKNVSVNYGPSDSSMYIVENGTIIIGQRVDEYVNYDLNNYENQMKYMKRNIFLGADADELKTSIAGDLGISVSVIKYVDETVKLKESNQEEIHL